MIQLLCGESIVCYSVGVKICCSWFFTLAYGSRSEHSTRIKFSFQSRCRIYYFTTIKFFICTFDLDHRTLSSILISDVENLFQRYYLQMYHESINYHLAVLMLLTEISTRSEDVPDVTLVFQRLSYGRSFNATCVVSGNSMDSAITWNEPLSSTAYYALNYVSDYVPDRRNSYNCDISSSDFTGCNHLWIGSSQWLLENSLISRLGPVLDKRWEDFPIIHTDGNLNFKKVVDIPNHRQFKLHFSVRAQEVQIYICDDVKPNRGNCYWIIMAGWEGTASAVRKCYEGQIPVENRVYAKEPCSTLRARINHTNPILSTEEWRHFTIERNMENILLWQIGNTSPVLKYTDNEAVIDTSYLIINSRGTPGYWKIHDYSYAVASMKINEVMGPKITVTQNNLCISMFVAMCAQCTLIVDVFYYDVRINNYRAFKRVFLAPKQGMEWQEEKIVIELPVVPTTAQFGILSECNNCKDPYWAIDNFQICSEKEIRVLTKTQNRDKVSCQAIKYPHRQLTQTNVDSNNPPRITCPNGTFSKKCIDCESVFGANNLHCEKSIICEFQSEGQTICRCINGYTGTTCEKECKSGFYGFNCEEKCGFCEYSPCHYITGICGSQCLYNFTGKQCKTAPLPILVNPPTVIEVKPTSLTVQIQNITYEGIGEPKYYILQYKEKMRNDWTSMQRYYLTYTDPVNINNLKILTTYDIRAILVTNKEQIYDSEYVPISTETTTCTFIQENNIQKSIQNTSAIFIFEDTDSACPAGDYELTLNYRTIRSQTFTFKIDQLTPITNYHMEIKSSRVQETLTINFKTEEGAPSKVQQLKTTDNDATSIAVSWHPPVTSNGNIRHYKVQYIHIRYNSCKKNINGESRKTFEVKNNTFITLENLYPYSRYRIRVAAFTVMDGEFETTYSNTEPTESPEETEIPTIRDTESTSSSVKIILQQPDCTLIKGPVQYYITLYCSNGWCPQSPLTRNITHINYEEPLEVPELLPYSTYTVHIKVGRQNGKVFAGDGMTAMFTTKSSVPNPIKELVAYSRNETAVFLRWSPPYPPTGELSGYNITYCYKTEGWVWNNNDVCDSRNFSVAVCKLWKGMHCAVLRQLQPLQKYSILVYAKNVDTNYNIPTHLETETKQEAPGVPENLSASWDNYYNFTLIWNHPSFTNGPLTKFIIKIYSDKTAGECHTSELHVMEDNYNLTYTYAIPFTGFCLSSKLTVYVSAFNIQEGPSTKLENIFSPPPTPSFTSQPSVQHVTNTTMVIDLPAIHNAEQESTAYIIISTIGVEQTNIENGDTIQGIWTKAGVLNRASKWIAGEYDLRKESTSRRVFTVGNNTKSRSQRLNTEIYNRPLEIYTNYSITILLLNRYRKFERYRIYQLVHSTGGIKTEETHSSNYALFALILLLLIPIAVWVIIRRHKENKIINVPWSTLLGTANNPTRNNSNPDVIPLTSNTDKAPRVPTKPSQVRPKQKMPEGIPLQTSNANNVNDMFSKPVKITEFEKYVKESIESGELERQHELFPRGQTKPWDYGLLPQNKSKNRYNNLIAYDHSRVRLSRINNDKFSDYINANYIQGYNTNNAYIATQGPKASTVNDFWRMIWQEKVNYIVMLANVLEGGKKKSEQYWPGVHEFLEFEKIKVEYVSSQVFADYEYRTFSVSCENNERKVEQLHFTSWPDHGVPLYSQSLVPFLRKLLTISQGTSPIVVHCSAGVGRTGTIILCDLCLRMAAREGVVDVLKHQHNMREQRANLVDNVEQYKLAHLVLLQCLIAPQTSITCDEEMETAVLRLLESGKLKKQIQYLSDTAWQDQAMRPAMEVTSNPKWETKNRFPDIIPCGYGRIYLSRYPATDEHSDYINAVEVDGFRAPQRFIVTQQPMPHTVSDFWRMVDEKEVTTIVSLNKINKEDKTSCIFWPTEKVSEIQPVPYITLQFHTKTRDEYFNVITVYLQNNKNKINSKRTVHLIVLKGWAANKLVPETDVPLLKLWGETEKVSRGDNPIVVTCYDGVTSCGLFLALSFIIEKMKLDQQCDVCLAVRTIRPNRKQFVTEAEQFSFLYRAALSYLSSFDLYSNFTPATGKK